MFGRMTMSAVFVGAILSVSSPASNPVITHMRTADPSCRVWADGKVWMYASQDQPDATSYDTMDGYHVFSSSNLVDWTDHGQAFHSSNVSWGITNGGFMWAPDCAYKNGIYYFYYPHLDSTSYWRIGVATSALPQGPFVDIGHWIEGTDNTDPCVFIDDDGQAYLYWSPNPYMGIPPRVALLKTNMIELAEAPRYIDYGASNCKEGAFMHKYKGKYYYSYTDWNDPVDQGYYAVGDSPYGPFTYKGALNAAPPGAQDHHSIVPYKGQWYYFYHVGNYNGTNQYRRNTCIDYLYYNTDGTIQTIQQTTQGVSAATEFPTSWSAYNDCAWSAGESITNITTNSPLKIYRENLLSRSNGFWLPPEVIFATNAASGVNFIGQSATMPAGSDVETWFAGKVGANNAANWGGGTVSLSFTGLNTGSLYNIVLWSSRGASSASYSNRFTEILITGATSFTNLSSAGLERYSATAGTRVRASLAPGAVARYDGVNPGSDGVVIFTLTAGADTLWAAAGSATNGYLNAFAIFTSTNTATNGPPPAESNSPGWTAYNDLAWVSGQLTSNITTWSPAGTTAGSLVNYASGAALAVQASVICDSAIGIYNNPANLTGGTPAETLFTGKVSMDGYANWSQGTVTLTLANMDPAKQYSVALFGSRGQTNYTYRWCDVRITDVAAFVNSSSTGTVLGTVSMANDQGRILAANTAGLVWRYDAIQPGSDGDVTFVVTSGGSSSTGGYLNAFMVTELPSGTNVDAYGVSDSWKLQYFGSTNVDLMADADGDGYSNLDEYIAATGPTSGGSLPELGVGWPGGLASVEFNGATQRLYSIDFKTNLMTPWASLAVDIAGSNGIQTVPLGMTNRTVFYRFRVRVAP